LELYLFGEYRVVLKKLIFVQIVKKFPVVSGSEEFIALFTRVLYTKHVG
jgi:hypothetical protein